MNGKGSDHTFGINTVQLNNIANNLRTSSNRLDEIFNDVKSTVADVNNHFVGEAATSYMNSFQNFQKSFDDFRDLINRMATAIDQTVEDFNASDVKISNTVE